MGIGVGSGVGEEVGHVVGLFEGGVGGPIGEWVASLVVIGTEEMEQSGPLQKKSQLHAPLLEVI